MVYILRERGATRLYRACVCACVREASLTRLILITEHRSHHGSQAWLFLFVGRVSSTRDPRAARGAPVLWRSELFLGGEIVAALRGCLFCKS